MEIELPLAIQYGMPLNIFWNEDPDLLKIFQERYFEKIALEQKTLAYYNGLTTYIAIGKAFSKNETFPEYEEIFGDSKKVNKSKSEEEKKEEQDKASANFIANANKFFAKKKKGV